jgi:argininosuccinate lyase
MLWGGRFKNKLDDDALNFSSSLKFDINLIYEDIEGSIAHTKMLAKVKLIKAAESKKIVAGLKQIRSEFENGKWKPSENKFEDIHSAIESRLFELIGETAGKLHTARSRNDQVATDLRLWIKKSCNEIINLISWLQKTLISISEKNTDTIIPGYTHLQRAQPISLAFHLLAYVEMLERDKKRFSFTLTEADQSPLGSGALAGSTLPLDRNFTTNELGFSEPTGNALDSVSDRDFTIDFLNGCAIGMMHLSRLSEEIIIWSTSEWNFIKLSDSFSTGSSLMPQKKNPDITELIRGKSGRVYGNYISLLTTMKSLPLSYNRDLQEDKESIFDSAFTFSSSLEMMKNLIASAKFNKERFKAELEGDFSMATDLADWLVMKGIPFREAHSIVGKIVVMLEEKGTNFKDLTLEMLKEVNPVFDKSALECLNISTALKRKKTYGSTNPQQVKQRIQFWKRKIK